MLSMEDCAIDNWQAFDQLNEFPAVKNLRVMGNPIMEKALGSERAREIAIARVQFVWTFNGSTLEESHRRDYEIYYMKDAYRQFLEAIGDQASPTCLEDERVSIYMIANHSRFFQLCEKFGSPIGMVQIQKEMNMLSNSSAKVEIISEVEATKGKSLNKKLLLTMSVA